MPTADLRALAERLGMLMTCGVCEGDGDWDGKACPFCHGAGKRLPTEAEVRAAIFEAKHGVTVYAGPTNVSVVISGGHVTYATRGEALPDQHVLLALLRALEVARDGR